MDIGYFVVSDAFFLFNIMKFKVQIFLENRQIWKMKIF